MTTCDICNKTYRRRDNMLRHKRSVHRPEESENSDTDQSLAEDSDQAESEYEETVDKYDPWDSLIQKTFKQCQPQFQAKVYSLTHSRIGQEDARHKEYKELQPMFRKALMAYLRDRMIWFKSFQAVPIYKTIRNTAKALIEMEEYNRDEALKYAIRKRKYLLDSVLEEFQPQEMMLMMISQLVKDSNLNIEKNMRSYVYS